MPSRKLRQLKKPPADRCLLKQQRRRRPKKETAAKKETAVSAITIVIAKVDVGYGNSLYIRGEGANLSWEKGILMENAGDDEWSWSTSSVPDQLVFKFLVNDEIWSAGDNFTIVVGETLYRPRFFRDVAGFQTQPSGRETAGTNTRPPCRRRLSIHVAVGHVAVGKVDRPASDRRKSIKDALSQFQSFLQRLKTGLQNSVCV